MDISFTPVDNKRLANLCGVLDENLRQIETALGVKIARRGENFRVEGGATAARQASELLKQFYERAQRALSVDEVQLGLVEIVHTPVADDVRSVDMMPVLMTRKTDLHARPARQNSYLRQIQEFDITFGIGPAGTGKTYLAVNMNSAARCAHANQFFASSTRASYRRRVRRPPPAYALSRPSRVALRPH